MFEKARIAVKETYSKLMKRFGQDRFSELEDRNERMQKRLEILQSSFADILSATETGGVKYTGNKYKSYDAKVDELSSKYDGCSDWGCTFAQMIIGLRSVFTLAGGINLKAKKNKDAKKEIEFIQTFLKHNNLDNEAIFDWGDSAEIEGKFLAGLYLNSEKKNVDARFVSYKCRKYKIKTAPNDYAVYEEASWSIDSASYVLKKENFVYKKFAGQASDVNTTPSKVSKVLLQMENLDKALWDWRKINSLFASPTPVIEVEDKDEEKARKIQESINKTNWRIGKLLVTTGKFKYAEVGMASQQSIASEILNYIKVISGVTCIPPHFLGAPELMSNRATSSDLFDLIEAGVKKEREIWEGAYREMFEKAIIMANAAFSMSLDPEAFEVSLPQASEHKLKEIVDMWLPLFTSDVIDHDTILEKIPGVDAEQVKKNKKKELLDQIDELKAQARAEEHEHEKEPAAAGAGA